MLKCWVSVLSKGKSKVLRERRGGGWGAGVGEGGGGWWGGRGTAVGIFRHLAPQFNYSLLCSSSTL